MTVLILPHPSLQTKRVMSIFAYKDKRMKCECWFLFAPLLQIWCANRNLRHRFASGLQKPATAASQSVEEKEKCDEYVGNKYVWGRTHIPLKVKPRAAVAVPSRFNMQEAGP